MGEVYRARDPRLGREVAIKILPAAYASDADRLRRFEQEARAASALDHPNLPLSTMSALPTGRRTSSRSYSKGRRCASGWPVRRCRRGERSTTRGKSPTASRRRTRRGSSTGIRSPRTSSSPKTSGSRSSILASPNWGQVGRVEKTSRKRRRCRRNRTWIGAGDRRVHVAGASAWADNGRSLGHFLLRRHRLRNDCGSAGLFARVIGRDDERDSCGGAAGALVRGGGVSPGIERIVRHCLEKSPEARFQSARDLAFALGEVASGGASAVRSAGAEPVASRSRPAIQIAAVVTAAVALLLILVVANVGGIRTRVVGVPPRAHRLDRRLSARELLERSRAGILRRRHDRGAHHGSGADRRAPGDSTYVRHGLQNREEAVAADRQGTWRRRGDRRLGPEDWRPSPHHCAVG